MVSIELVAAILAPLLTAIGALFGLVVKMQGDAVKREREINADLRQAITGNNAAILRGVEAIASGMTAMQEGFREIRAALMTERRRARTGADG